VAALRAAPALAGRAALRRGAGGVRFFTGAAAARFFAAGAGLAAGSA